MSPSLRITLNLLYLSFLVLGNQMACSQISSRKSINGLYLNLFKPTEDASPESTDIWIDTSDIETLCPRNALFASMHRTHMQAVSKMLHMLKDVSNIEDGLKIAAYLKTRVNLNAWYYAVTAWAISDSRMQSVPKPSPVDIVPDMFINDVVMAKAKAQMNAPRRQNANEEECFVVDGSAGIDNGVENALWYFREDIMINAHHMYYHMIYPAEEVKPVRESRRSELFYFMHREALARYNAERLSHGFAPVKPMEWGIGSRVQEGYYPHLGESVSGYGWGKREPNTPLADLHFGTFNPTIRDMVTLNFRIMQAADSGTLLAANGSLVQLNTIQGIDIFGDALEQNLYSLNKEYYGLGTDGLHNIMHTFIALAPDPNGALNLPFGVMAHTATSLRDIIFYRWHAYVNELFDRHKKTLEPYTPTNGELPLIWTGVIVDQIQVLPGSDGISLNQLTTYWGEKRFQLRRGLDHTGNFSEPVFMCAKHLDHEEFVYKIVVNNTNANTAPATVRIFLSPRYNEHGARFEMSSQRNFLFNLDVFTTTLIPGENVILRRSNESNAVLPWHKHFDELENEDSEPIPICGCGFPLHLQIPKGSVNGTVYDLVVMVTNGLEDAVEHEHNGCQAAYLYCGLANTPYPDAKPMAYPFDRMPYNVDEFGNPSVNGTAVSDLDEYVRHVPNMNAVQLNITHNEI